MGDCLSAEGVFMKMDDYAAHQEPRIFWKLQRHSAPELTRLMLRAVRLPGALCVCGAALV